MGASLVVFFCLRFTESDLKNITTRGMYNQTSESYQIDKKNLESVCKVFKHVIISQFESKQSEMCASFFWKIMK